MTYYLSPEALGRVLLDIQVLILTNAALFSSARRSLSRTVVGMKESDTYKQYRPLCSSHHIGTEIIG
jgi:hypothetical protein